MPDADNQPLLEEDFSKPDSGGETCGICGRGYMLWHAPQPLWDELIGHYHGTRCPKCFDDLAREKAILITWTPMVVRRDGVMTTNWWSVPPVLRHWRRRGCHALT